MPNPNMPFGFEPIKTDGKENKVSYYEKEASAIYRGDALHMTATGKVQVAAAGEVICGIAAESKSAASTDKIAVYDDPDQEFMVQMSGVFAQTDVGLNADIVANAPDTVLSHSKHELDTTTEAVTAALQFKILGLMPRGVNAMGANAIAVVKPNNHLKSAGVAGI